MAKGIRLPFESIEELDAELARLAQTSGAMRARLGASLEALAQISGHHDMGFSSMEAYALERCERAARWVQKSRWLARRLKELPHLARALATGAARFSMAQLLAKIATPDDETAWLEVAHGRTVREMRRLTRERRPANASCEETNVLSAITAPADELATLTVTVDREDAWLFECARTIAQHVGGLTMDETVEALLGEGTTSLLETTPRDRMAPFDDAPTDSAQRAWEEQLAQWRDEAEARCESKIPRAAEGDDSSVPAVPVSLRQEDPSSDAEALDAELRRIAAALSRRDLEMGQLAEAFWIADGWRRLGYATNAQYTRERLGCSLSSIKAKRALARRVERMPKIAVAVASGELGYEAARLVASVAAPDTADAWVARARERTVRFLREEVDAVTMLRRLDPRASAAPPSDAAMQAFAALESRIVSGAAFRDAAPPANGATSHDASGATSHDASGAKGQMSAALAAVIADFDRARGPSLTGLVPPRAEGRVTLRLRVSVGTRRYYRWLEGLFVRLGFRRSSFLRFLCTSLVDTWWHALGSEGAYAAVYARDRYRCTNPVCTRRDVTPHHLRFRSAGGDDSAGNVASLCVWCHLEGVHGGRLRAAPPADHVAWEIGRRPHTVVRGRWRERVAEA